MKKSLPWIAAVSGGILGFLGYAGFDLFFLEWICLVPILWAIRDQSPGRAFLIGWVAGIIGHAGGFYWVVLMFRQFAGMPWPLAALGLLLLAAANGIVFAVWAWATRLICRDTGWSVVWVSPVIWTAAEKFWPEMFPNYLGASQYKLSLLTQIADVTGILGLTFFVVYANSFLYGVLERRIGKKPFPLRSVLIFTGIVALLLGYGAIRISNLERQSAAAQSLKVGIVQTNLGAGAKHDDPEYFLKAHRAMSQQLINNSPLDLIVWPESVFGTDLASRQGEFPPAMFGDLKTPLLFGAVLRIRRAGESPIYNSAVLVNEAGRIIGTYDKTVLVPFGEYIPFGDIYPRLYAWSPNSSRFWSGENNEPLIFGNKPLSVSVCYEDIFPGHIRRLMQGGREKRIPMALFNMTNDSWYGNTVQPMEHLALASFRAIEHRRALVRATNTGISAIVDPMGRFDLRTGQWTRETLVGSVPLLNGRTIYAVLGDWLGWVCGLLSLVSIGRALSLSKRRDILDAGKDPTIKIRK